MMDCRFREGKLEGEAKAKEELTFNMYKNSIDIDVIAKIFGLTEQQIKLIIDNK